MVVSVMRIERYYSSVREEVSNLNDDAITLLDRQDYVGFFKACGSNYVRGIRRAQEVTAIFLFEADSIYKAREFAKTIAQSGFKGRRYSDVWTKTEHTKTESTLTIDITGYGLGLGVKSSETLVATSLAEYNEVMKFAFRSMTQSKDSHHIGMVYGIEVLPWVDNASFQVAARLLDEVILVPQPRSLIPKATSPNATLFVNDNSTRALFQCKNSDFSIDKYGSCCETNSLYNFTTQEYDGDTPSLKVCRPVRALAKSIVKMNMAANGEFVARLDRSLRYKVNQLATLQRCITASREIPSRYEFNVLKSIDGIKRDDVEDPDFTLFELRSALDPFNDYALVDNMARELDEFAQMFYAPCLAALFGTNIGLNPNTDPIYFMAYPWHTHKACSYMSCFSEGFRWNRNEPGCVPGLVTGPDTAASYDTDTDEDQTYCDKDNKLGGEKEVCSHNTTDLGAFHTKASGCWNKTIPSGQITYFMENYCMPNITPMQVDPQVQISLKIAEGSGCGKTYGPTDKSDRFTLNSRTTKAVIQSLRGSCSDGNTAILRFNSRSYAADLVYRYETKTITHSHCNKPLTLEACGAPGTPQNLSFSDSVVGSGGTSIQQWALGRDGSISTIGCPTTEYLATQYYYWSNDLVTTTDEPTDTSYKSLWEANPYEGYHSKALV